MPWTKRTVRLHEIEHKANTSDWESEVLERENVSIRRRVLSEPAERHDILTMIIPKIATRLPNNVP